MSNAFEVHEGLADLLRKTAEQCEPVIAESREAGLACAVDDLVALCIYTADAFTRWSRRSFDALFSNQLDNPQAMGEQMRRALGISLRSVDITKRYIASVKQAGYAVEREDEFWRASEALTHLREELEKRWPWLHDDVAQASLEAFGRGESQAVEDILRELKG